MKTKIPQLIIAGLLAAAPLVPAATVILADDFDSYTISGGNEVVGNTISFTDGWDTDVTGTASDLTPVSSGFSTQIERTFISSRINKAGGVSFTFTSNEYWLLTDLSIDVDLANARGANRTSLDTDPNSTSVTISDAGMTVYQDTIAWDTTLQTPVTGATYLGTNGVRLNFGAGASDSLTAFKEGTEYTVTIETGGAYQKIYNNLSLTAALPEPSSSALLGLGLSSLLLRRRRS